MPDCSWCNENNCPMTSGKQKSWFAFAKSKEKLKREVDKRNEKCVKVCFACADDTQKKIENSGKPKGRFGEKNWRKLSKNEINKFVSNKSYYERLAIASEAELKERVETNRKKLEYPEDPLLMEEENYYQYPLGGGQDKWDNSYNTNIDPVPPHEAAQKVIAEGNRIAGQVERMREMQANPDDFPGLMDDPNKPEVYTQVVTGTFMDGLTVMKMINSYLEGDNFIEFLVCKASAFEARTPIDHRLHGQKRLDDALRAGYIRNLGNDVYEVDQGVIAHFKDYQDMWEKHITVHDINSPPNFIGRIDPSKCNPYIER